VVPPPDSEPLSPFIPNRPLVPFIKSAKPEKKIYMFEQSEFINFPGLSAFYGTLGRSSFASFSGYRKADGA